MAAGDGSFGIYQNGLHKRLPLLKYQHASAILEAIHQPGEVCDRIAGFAGRMNGEIEELEALAHDL